MNLHYSQTSSCSSENDLALYLYEFTLLSNGGSELNMCKEALYLYEFTLLSNNTALMRAIQLLYTSMNLHYSQTTVTFWKINIPLYTSMNLHYSQTLSSSTICRLGFIPLWIYITLKQFDVEDNTNFALYLYEFTLLSNRLGDMWLSWELYTSMNLHYSQTWGMLQSKG